MFQIDYMNPFLTIFTPVYNRAYIVEKLYESLCRQSCKDFEWVVVDDGSSDNIDELMSRFISEKKIDIKYFKQTNGGKHRAINRGVNEASGKMFFIVDSDDYLLQEAVSMIKSKFNEIESDSTIAGIGFMRCYENGNKIGSKLPFNELCCNAFHLTYKIKAKGDMAETYKTKILKEFPFPEIKNEKFCPEALVWYRIANKYKMLWINQCIYVCEYLKDGLSNSIVKLRRSSPKTSMLFYSEVIKNNYTPFFLKLKHAINFWRFSFNSEESFYNKLKKIGSWGILFFPFGYVFYKKDQYEK